MLTLAWLAWQRPLRLHGHGAEQVVLDGRDVVMTFAVGVT